MQWKKKKDDFCSIIIITIIIVPIPSSQQNPLMFFSYNCSGKCADKVKLIKNYRELKMYFCNKTL